MDGDVGDRILEALSEVKQEIAGMAVHQEQTSRTVARLERVGDELTKHVSDLSHHQENTTIELRVLNGRLVIVERWRSEQMLAQARSEGVHAGAATALVTRTQWRGITGLVAAIGMVAGSVSAVIVLVARLLA